MNVFSLISDPIRRRPGNLAIRFGSRDLTYAGFDAATRAFAARLKEEGCRPGDRVVIFLRNSFAYPVFLLGAMRAGFVAVPVNAKLHPAEVAYICTDCEPAVVIAEAKAVEAIKAALPEGSRSPCFLDADAFDFAAAGPAAQPAASVTAECAPDDPAWIFYTSGTTGRPKGATLTHRNLIAAAVNCLADIHSFAEGERVLHVAPLSHGSGLYLIASLARGTLNIISDRPGFHPEQALDIVAREKVETIAFVAPTMIVRLLEAQPREDIGSLKCIIYGGAPIHLEHLKAAVKRFGPIFVQLYGQGEAPMTISYLPAKDHLSDDDELLVSAGYVRAGVEVAILDEAGNRTDGEGEIAVRGDVVMKGYWRNEKATLAALQDGWLRTGDVGRFDSKGRLHVLDRRHDMIISGGTNIYPKEIEDVLAAHPAVAEVIVFGLPDREWGESVAAAVVAKQDDLSAEELIAHCRQRLASFKKPRRVFFVDELPKSAYGKVLRRELRDRFKAEV